MIKDCPKRTFYVSQQENPEREDLREDPTMATVKAEKGGVMEEIAEAATIGARIEDTEAGREEIEEITGAISAAEAAAVRRKAAADKEVTQAERKMFEHFI